MAFHGNEVPIQASVAQKKIVEMLMKEGTLIVEMMKEILKSTSYLDTLTREEFQRNLNEIKQLKAEAELVKREFLEYISKVSPTLLYRDEWIRLFSKMTSITDKIVGIAYRFEQILNHRTEIPRDVTSLFSKFSEEVINILVSIKEALNFMLINVTRALKACDLIEEKEKEIDNIYRGICFTLLEKDLPLREMLLLKEVAEMLETIADTAEYASDDLRIILLNMM
ncbi:MAG: hypothetical protein DRJ51_07975 [Thermoprotei archaeon]|nr:MAG: hypothetical protein DRJ51_07975 [Thermoprotei archaeon]